MSKDVCKSCHGLKKMMGLGMIETTCRWCAGTGKDIEHKAKKLADEKMEKLKNDKERNVKTKAKAKVKEEVSGAG